MYQAAVLMRGRVRRAGAVAFLVHGPRNPVPNLLIDMLRELHAVCTLLEHS
jgi:hypothetical protein